MNNTFTLHELCMRDLDPRQNILIIGRERSGKTTLIKKILQNVQSLTIFAFLLDGNYDDCDSTVLFDDISQLKGIFQRIKYYAQTAYIQLPHHTLVVDELICEPKWEERPYAKDFITNCSEMNTRIILSFRYPVITDKKLIDKFGYVFISWQNPTNYEYIYNIYLHDKDIISFEEFQGIMECMDRKIGIFLVIDYQQHKVFYQDKNDKTMVPAASGSGRMTKSALKR